MKKNIFETICNNYNLGELTEPPKPLTGGFMHKMYSLQTVSGKYAVKLLNPHIMKRETAQANYRTAEKLEQILEQHNIPIIPSLPFNNKKMQKIEDQYFYLFNWFDGKALKSEDITPYRCEMIGKILAYIHNIDKKAEAFNRNEININWDFYIEKIKSEYFELFKSLSYIRSLLYESQSNGNRTIKALPKILSICHNDMDSKNVLWKNNKFRIIDLECLRYSSPFLELFELALCWSGYENCSIDREKFYSFIKSYSDANGALPENWDAVYYSNYGRLEWLEYNLKRVLGIDSGDDEKEMGLSEAKETISHIIYYASIKKELMDICNDFTIKEC